MTHCSGPPDQDWCYILRRHGPSWEVVQRIGTYEHQIGSYASQRRACDLLLTLIGNRFH